MLKLVFNVESTKESMSILLLLDLIFHMWEMVLVEWENCNISNKTRDVPTHLPIPIEKSMFGCFSNLRKIIGEVGSRFSHKDNHYP